jgi:hypothetical protein
MKRTKSTPRETVRLLSRAELSAVSAAGGETRFQLVDHGESPGPTPLKKSS